MALEGDHFYVDLVFYNRLLSCFVLIDLTHQDLGQMQMYVDSFKRHQREEHEAPTVGIVLCSDKNDAMVKSPCRRSTRRSMQAAISSICRARRSFGKNSNASEPP